jgi:hypothetical protein
MPEMPIDQESDRFIDGVTTTPDGGALVNVEDMDNELEELPDGSVVVHDKEFKTPEDDEDFYSNLAETVDIMELDGIALRYIGLVEKDKEAREKRDKQYEEGLKRTGMGDDAPGGATFMGASRVVHPSMTEACIDFAARAMKEMFPQDGPVRTNILGDHDEEKLEVAERKRDYMNWQLTEQIEEYRDEMEQMLTQLPMGGSQFMKLWYDERKKRPCAEFVPIDNLYVPFGAVNFYTAQRVTEKQDITEYEFKRRIRDGLYRDTDFVRATMEPEKSAAEKANEKIEGLEYQDNEDGIRTVYHIYTWLDLEDDPRTKGEYAPYVLMIDVNDNKILGLYRNWEDGDETFEKLDWLVEFKFIPWRGAYAIGLPHIMGGLSAALTGALRALLDTAHINNSATMVKLKGAKISGQSQQIDVTQVVEIEAAPGVDDIRKIAMPMPFNPPSQVLFSLLGYLDTAAKGVISTAEEKIADITSNTPVGTTQALIEQGAAVFSSIHARMHNSQKKLLNVLGRINRWYVEDQKKGDVVAELPISPEDFKRNTDVIPVSDPHIFSETQRMAQNQAIMAMAQQAPPGMFDMRAVYGRMMKQMKVPNIKELMPNSAKPVEMNAADENAAMALGRPAFAYINQNQLAHLQSHLNFFADPALGSNPIIAPQYVPQALEHIKQHMIMWYSNQMHAYSSKVPAASEQEYANSKFIHEIDKAIALASDHVKMDTADVFKGVMPVIQQMMQMMQQLHQQPQMDPASQAMLQASMAETQRRAAKDQADTQFDMQKLQQDIDEKEKQRQADFAMNAEDNLTQERMKREQLSLDDTKLRAEQSDTVMLANQMAQRSLGG